MGHIYMYIYIYIYMLETFVIKRVPLRASTNTWWEFPLFKVSVNMCVIVGIL
jgi:hypothetical protein